MTIPGHGVFKAIRPVLWQEETNKEGPKMASTKEVLDNHLKCFGNGDLKGILSDYAPGAVLFTPDGRLRGAGKIRLP
jgi:hypothetical protein